jgi:ankyrin repeat protein
MDHKKYNAMFEILGANDVKLLKYHLNRGDDPNDHPVNYHSPLEMGIHNNNADVVRMLLEAGADPNRKSSGGDTSLTFLFDQVDRMKPEIVTLLIHYGANPHISNSRGDTPYILLEENRESLSDQEYKELFDILDSLNESIKEPDPDQ